MKIFINITDEQGILLGRVEVGPDDLLHPAWIGQQVIEQLPAELRP